MTVEDFENEQAFSIRHFIFAFIFGLLGVAAITTYFGCTLAEAQSDGVDVLNRPLPMSIPYEDYQFVRSQNGYFTGEDIQLNPYSIHEFWLASGFTIDALNAALANQNQLRYACELKLQALMTPPAPELSDKRIGKFLWKPVSEGGGAPYNNKLVVLVDEDGLDVRVKGVISEDLFNAGSLAGYGSGGRSTHAGCQFGNQVIVTFFDERGRVVPTKKGGQSVLVSDGCARSEQRF